MDARCPPVGTTQGGRRGQRGGQIGRGHQRIRWYGDQSRVAVTWVLTEENSIEPDTDRQALA
jgi:hypothetical protein